MSPPLFQHRSAELSAFGLLFFRFFFWFVAQFRCPVLLLLIVQRSSKSIFLAPNIAVFFCFDFETRVCAFFPCLVVAIIFVPFAPFSLSSHSFRSIFYFICFERRWDIIFLFSLPFALCTRFYLCVCVTLRLSHGFYVVAAKLCKYDAILSSEWQAVDFWHTFLPITHKLGQMTKWNVSKCRTRVCVCLYSVG